MKQKFEYLTRPWLDAPREGLRWSIPELWERAKALFAALLEAGGGKERLQAPQRMSRTQRREILGRLEPVEKLVRVLLLTKAVTFLLMTPQGRALMKTTPKHAPWKEPPPPPSPPPPPGTTRTVRIPYPGWHTIACNNRPPPPPPPPPRPAAAAARRAFKVLRVTPPAGPSGAPADALAAMRRSLFLGLYDDPTSRGPHRLAPRRPEAPVPAGERSSRLGLRIDALSRALEKPEPIVRRLARFLAGLPFGLIGPAALERAAAAGLWHCGQKEFVDACFHGRCALAAFDRIEPG